MKLTYVGTYGPQTIEVPGAGRVSIGETIEVRDDAAAKGLLERPWDWKPAGAGNAAGKKTTPAKEE